MTRPKEDYPVILSKADAFDYAAQQLGKMAADLALVKLIVDTLGQDKAGKRHLDKMPEGVRGMLVNTDAQIEATNAAARELKKMAVEERAIDARELAELRKGRK